MRVRDGSIFVNYIDTRLRVIRKHSKDRSGRRVRLGSRLHRRVTARIMPDQLNEQEAVRPNALHEERGRHQTVHQGKAQQESGERTAPCLWQGSALKPAARWPSFLSASSHAVFPDVNACNHEINRLFGAEH